MTAGFVREGFAPVLAVEWNLHAAATYAGNFGESHTVWGDIADLDEGAIPAADLVIDPALFAKAEEIAASVPRGA